MGENKELATIEGKYVIDGVSLSIKIAKLIKVMEKFEVNI